MGKSLNHIGIVTDDLEKAVKFWQDGLGLPITVKERNEEEAVDIVFLGTDTGSIELIAPITSDSGIAKYLAKRGAGQHHICIEVEDIEATMQHLTQKGFELINDKPRKRHDGTLYAFTHPKSTGGVMVELYQKPS
ncbi:MAG: methylmalonyl-CoA epimerase [Phototrophicales bacterium]